MNTSDNRNYGRHQSSLEPAGDLRGQDSLDPQNTDTPKPSLKTKLLAIVLPAVLIVVIAVILNRQGSSGSETGGSTPSDPSSATEESTPAAEDESAAAEETASVEEEPVEIILPDAFGDQLCDFGDDRYITNLNHYTDEPTLLGKRQEAVVIPWDALTDMGALPSFFNHMSESLSVSFDNQGDFPYTDYTFSYSLDSAQEEASRNIDFLRSNAGTFEELAIGNITEYSCKSGTYLLYEVLKDYSSGPSLETYALRDLDGGGCFTVLLDQFYPSSLESGASITIDLVDDRYSEEFLEVLNALECYPPDQFSSITAASPWGQQCYYAYDNGKTVFVDAKLSDASLPHYGFDHCFMTDNTMTLRFREDNTSYSSCSRSFIYTEPPNEDNVYTVPSYHVTESIHYEFFPLYEENFYTNYVTAVGASPTGTTASQISSFTVDGRSFYARYVKTDNPGDYYPQGEATVYVWFQVSGNVGLIIGDHLQNFGDGPEGDFEEIAVRLAGTIKDIH